GEPDDGGRAVAPGADALDLAGGDARRTVPAALADIEDRRLLQAHATREPIALGELDHARAAGLVRQLGRRIDVGADALGLRRAGDDAELPVAVELAVEPVGALGVGGRGRHGGERVLERVARAVEPDDRAGHRRAVV